MTRYKQSQRFRIVSGNVSFYTTAKQIREGVGAFTEFNGAVYYALATLESEYKTFVGLATTRNGIQVQIDVVE